MRFDAVIAGAGPAGAMTATLLARTGWRVALIEKRSFPRRKVCGEFISATSLPLLQRAGIWDQFTAEAGPDIRRVGLFTGAKAFSAAMPGATQHRWGRALGRHHLDTMLRDAAVGAGATLIQPAVIRSHARNGECHECIVERDGQQQTLSSRVVIDATGSWERGCFSPSSTAAAPSDLLAFKARFLGARLPADLMPMLAFPGGYGGMATSDSDCVTLSCCIRRDALAAARKEHPAQSAGHAVLQHIVRHCEPVGDVLGPAVLDGAWLAAGPIRPGIRRTYVDGVFCAGNAAGEAHPVIAEGISMALQSAQLLAGALMQSADLDVAARSYATSWRNAFAMRIRASSMFARIAMSSRAQVLAPVVGAFPQLLAWGAILAGKTRVLPDTADAYPAG